MGSRLTLPSAGQTGGEAGVAPNSIFNVVSGSSDLLLGDITVNTKYEIEYGFALEAYDKIQMGRLTIVYDGIEVICTSHEIEDSGNLGSISEVTFDGYLDGLNIGIRFENISGEDFAFNYNIVNKFNITYTPNVPITGIVVENVGPRAGLDMPIGEQFSFPVAGQTFKLSQPDTVTRVQVEMGNFNPITTGSVVLEMFDSVGGNSLGVSQLVDVTTLTPSNYTFTDFIFDTPINLGITEYFFDVVMTPDSVDRAFSVRLATTDGLEYLDGDLYLDGVVYTAGTTFDMRFKIFNN